MIEVGDYLVTTKFGISGATYLVKAVSNDMEITGIGHGHRSGVDIEFWVEESGEIMVRVIQSDTTVKCKRLTPFEFKLLRTTESLHAN